MPQDTVTKKTKAIEDEWIPVWNEEFEFPLSVPELAVLRVEVLEYDTSGSADSKAPSSLGLMALKRPSLMLTSLIQTKLAVGLAMNRAILSTDEAASEKCLLDSGSATTFPP